MEYQARGSKWSLGSLVCFCLPVHVLMHIRSKKRQKGKAEACTKDIVCLYSICNGRVRL